MPSVNEEKTGLAYWRSLDELSDSPRFREQADREFALYAPREIVASPTRRTMVKLMGASMALAGVSGLGGCRRWPERELAPYNQRPEDRIPGLPEKYATVMELGGVGQPLVVSSYDGRPIKVEGNPDHPLSGGACSTFAQASVLDMYDPHRSRGVLTVTEGKQTKATWPDVEKAIADLGLAASRGEGFVVLSEACVSPTFQAMRRGLLEKLPKARWFEYEPLSMDNEEIGGAKLAFGRPLRSHLRLDRADVVVCLDADILWGHPSALKHARDFANGRRNPAAGKLNRLYAVESTLSLTGTNADRRLPLASLKVIEFAKALAAKLGVAGVSAGTLDEKAAAFADDVAKDLKAAGGRGLVVAGAGQPAEVHAAAALVNAALGNIGKTVDYTEVEDRPTHAQAIAQAVEMMNDGAVKSLLVVGGNPVYDAPTDLKFSEAMKKVGVGFHLGHYNNETSRACAWHLPRSHYLEAWGDARAWDGSVSVAQPLILPLFDTRSAVEALALFIGDEPKQGHDLVRRTLGQWIASDTFERGWRKVLHKGFVEGSASQAVEAQLAAGAAEKVNAYRPVAGEWELVFTADYSVYDGRFANNGWLQELPDPVTKLVWDNAAMVGPADAARLGVSHGGMIGVSVPGGKLDLPVYILPGQASGSIAVSLGYGRTAAGYVGDKVGFDAYQVRTLATLDHAAMGKPAGLSRRYTLVSTQDHHAIDPIGMKEREERATRDLVRVAPMDYFKDHKDFARHMGIGAPTKINEQGRNVQLQIFQDPADFENVHRWGMAIDLGSCIGCSACVVACQSENNIPIVGKREAERNREMHWLRIDRYFAGDENDPRIVQQPVTCHHCETAPCEQVCPVAATVHDSEGLNVMIYNRCVGTRYCSNNCPYKVRRFNYFDWQVKPVKGGPHTGTFLGIPDQQQSLVDPVRRLGFNPEVSVRMRGVMEKCTFCTQRIKAKTIPALNEFRQGKRATPFVRDGEITTACQQTCPTDAIVFGNLNDPGSRVSKMFADERAYEMLSEINVRARTRYLARVNNPGEGHGVNPTFRSPPKPHTDATHTEQGHE